MRTLVVLSAVVCLGSSAAFAQWSPGATANYGAGLGNIALSQSILNGMRRPAKGPHATNTAPGNAASSDDLSSARFKLGNALAAGLDAAILYRMTPAQIDAALAYRPDPQVSAKLRVEMIAKINVSNPAARPALEKAFDAALREFEGLVAAHGYSSHNVADATAAVLWTSWQDFAGAPLTEAQIRGVHQQVRAAFLSIPLRLPGAGRQVVAESAAYVVVFQAANTGNATSLQATQAAANMKSMFGMDFSQLEVTADSGFRQKRAAAALSRGPGAPAPPPGQDSMQAGNAEPAPVFAAPVRPLSPAPASASPQSSAVPADLAECLNQGGKSVPRWLDACTRAIEMNPGNKEFLASAHLMRASAYAQLRQFDRVIADCDEALRIVPQGPVSSLAHSLRGGALTQRHEFDRALADYDKAIASPSNPLLADAYWGRGNAYLQIANYERARADIDTSISLKPSSITSFSRAYTIRAQYRLEQDDDAGALADLTEGLRLDPQNADCYALRAEYYVRTGKFAEAQADADRALGMKPASAVAHAIRGRIALAQDRIEVALGELTEAIDVIPEPDAVANRGVAYERAGSVDRATVDYRRALQLLPTSKRDRDAQAMARQRIAALATAPAGTAALSVPAAPPGRRIALVIGMSAYANVAPLRNPASDARAVADAFRRLGFAEVIEREDLTRARLEETLKDFGDKAAEADWAVIYYAGHGLEMNGVNYLVPVDARLARAEHVEDEGVTLTRVLSKTDAARKLRVVILDACRNNPFRMASSAGRSRTIGRGLSPVEPARGVLVAYAARDGTTADDGDSGHSPFTEALLANLEAPGVDIRIMFSKVRDTVLARTNNSQEPFTYGSLPGQEFYFKQAVAR